MASNPVFTPLFNTGFQHTRWGQNLSFSALPGKDHVVVRDGRQMAWHLWKHLLPLMKQVDKVWLWPVLQWQPALTALAHRSYCAVITGTVLYKKKKQWPDNTDFGKLTAPSDQLFLFRAKGLGNLWLQKKQLAYSKTQDGAFCKYCAFFLPISLSLGVQALG